MRLDRVTVTGADDATPVEALWTSRHDLADAWLAALLALACVAAYGALAWGVVAP